MSRPRRRSHLWRCPSCWRQCSRRRWRPWRLHAVAPWRWLSCWLSQARPFLTRTRSAWRCSTCCASWQLGGPLLIAIDDAHWLDAASTSVLQISLRRLRDEPIGLLMTVREAPHESIVVELERCFPEDRVHRIERRSTQSRCPASSVAGAAVTRAVTLRAARGRRGDPRQPVLRARGRPRVGPARQPPYVRRAATGAEQLAAASRADDWIGSRHRHETCCSSRRLARRPTIEVIARTHGDHLQVVAALGEAIDAGVGDLSDGRFHFAHPLFASVIYERAPFEVRRTVHRALATTATDVEERVRHLARAADGPDPELALEMAAAAEHAAGRGAPAVAAQLCELAARIHPG